MKQLQQNTQKQLCDIDVGQDIVFNKTSKAQVTKPNIDIRDYIHYSPPHNQGNDRTKEKGSLFCSISDFSQ